MTFGPEIKDPASTVFYTIDWSDNIPTETIGTSAWSSTPSGLTVGTAGTFTGLSTTTTVSGGTAGTVYQITNRVTTNNAIVDERSIVVRVENL